MKPRFFFEMSDNAKLALCCFRLKNTPANKKIVDVVENTLEKVFDEAIAKLEAEAANQGIGVPVDLSAKLKDIARAHGLFAAKPLTPVQLHLVPEEKK